MMEEKIKVRLNHHYRLNSNPVSLENFSDAHSKLSVSFTKKKQTKNQAFALKSTSHFEGNYRCVAVELSLCTQFNKLCIILRDNEVWAVRQ